MRDSGDKQAMTYTDDDCNEETQPIVPVRQQRIETNLNADPPLPKLWTDELTTIEDDALDMVWAWAENSRRILRRMRAMMRNDGYNQPY